MTTDEPTPRPREAALATLLTEVKSESEQLREDVRNAERARKRANTLNTILLVAAVLLVGVVGMVGWQVQKTNARIADCSTVGGKCYEEGRRRTEGAVGAVVRISVFVAQCGRLFPGEYGPEFDAKIERCVADRLAASARVGQVGPTPGGTSQPSPSSSVPGR